MIKIIVLMCLVLGVYLIADVVATPGIQLLESMIGGLSLGIFGGYVIPLKSHKDQEKQ